MYDPDPKSLYNFYPSKVKKNTPSGSFAIFNIKYCRIRIKIILQALNFYLCVKNEIKDFYV